MGRRSAVLAGRRARYGEVLELEGLGRAAFALIANCNPYSYVGSLPLRVAPLARFELGLDVVAPRSVRARDLPRLVTYVVRGKGQCAATDIVYGHDLDRLVVDCDHALPLHVDGEDLGNVTEVLAVDMQRQRVVTVDDEPVEVVAVHDVRSRALGLCRGRRT